MDDLFGERNVSEKAFSAHAIGLEWIGIFRTHEARTIQSSHQKPFPRTFLAYKRTARKRVQMLKRDHDTAFTLGPAPWCETNEGSTGIGGGCSGGGRGDIVTAGANHKITACDSEVCEKLEAGRVPVAASWQCPSFVKC